MTMDSHLHLPRSLAGECKGENLAYLGLAFQHKTQETVAEYGGFSRSSPCTDHTVHIAMHSLKLVLVQFGLVLQ